MIFTKRCRPIEIMGLFCLSLFLFTWGVNSQEVIGFESRFYLFALEMWQDGIGWFPTTYHQPYPDYPVTSTLLIYLFSIAMGGVTKFSAVMPSAVVAAMTVTMTYLIGAKESKRLGLYAVFFLLLTFSFVKAARSITLDMYPTLMTTSCFYLIYSRDKEKKSIPWQWLSLFLLIGFAFRGPIGLVMPAGVICIYYLLAKQWKTCFTSGLIALFLLIMSSFILLLLAYYQGGTVFLHDVLRMEVVGRINHHLPPYFYLMNGMTSYLLSFPFALCMAAGLLVTLVCHRQNYHPQFVMQLIGWMMVILIGMSIPGDKKIRYILPMMPAAALLVAYLFIVDIKEKYFSYLRFTLRIFLLLSPIIFIAISLPFIYSKADLLTHLSIPFLQLIILLLSAQIVSLVCFFWDRNRQSWRDIVIFIIATLSFIVMNITVVEPIELYHERAHDFVARVETLRLQKKMNLVFYKERPDGLPIKYLINTTRLATPIFIQRENELARYTLPAFFVANNVDFANLSPTIAKQFHLVARDKLGHALIAVFERNIT